MSSIDHLFAEAARLPADQKLTLAHRLLASDEPELTPEAEQAWDDAIRERILKYDNGEPKSRPAGEVFSDLDKRLAK
jgi:hypothetical protein